MLSGVEAMGGRLDFHCIGLGGPSDKYCDVKASGTGAAGLRGGAAGAVGEALSWQ